MVRSRRRAVLAALICAGLVGGPFATGPAVAGERWRRRIDRLASGRNVGIAVREEGQFLYRRADRKLKAPASNEKLLLAMALLDRVDRRSHIPTLAASRRRRNGVIPGDLWVLGRGDPTVDRARLRTLARRIRGTGIRRVRGSVMGSTGHFRHDWWAPGWRSYFPREYIPLPSALTFEGNVRRGVHIRNPERRAAKALTRRLRALGVRVQGRPGKGRPPSGLEVRARVSSPTLMKLLRRMLRPSSNFFAEVLGKRLGVVQVGLPGTIAKGARAIRGWAAGQGVTLEAHDSSGLSYDNRVAPRGISRLLEVAERRPWGGALKAALPGPGQGTLEDRLGGVRVRAKTGTLTKASTLSGWVWLQRRQTWAEFSIMSRGMSTDAAKSLEDEVVRILWRRAH